ncbi:uncharacterized protein LOC110670181 [Hevea brasiliensis]|uniref:uncharacterized protein LOC110670181 n=1 Tax=Hevea brasiliensis TaxID=3981 RepID=UPI0025ECFB42|nr:uncharacterized protein LOC110670181 [Hevea brasiliensis]
MATLEGEFKEYAEKAKSLPPTKDVDKLILYGFSSSMDYLSKQLLELLIPILQEFSAPQRRQNGMLGKQLKLKIFSFIFLLLIDLEFSGKTKQQAMIECITKVKQLLL